MLERHDTDILILGSGGAGLFAALHALKAAPDLKVTVVVKGLLGKCGCTRMVQGGYNVALSQGDSVERHFMDTIIGGKWLPHQAIAWKLCESAVVRVRELENEIGCFFDRNDELGERGTRDVVSRAIYSEMRKGNTTRRGGVYLSMSHLGPADVRVRFRGMVRRCADCGFDLAAGKVEVVPTAHYFMGGLICDPDTRTGLPGLYVAGEDAGGAHGSNRLGGNGVANSTVYGGIAGDVMGVEARTRRLADPDEALLDAEIARTLHPFSKPRGDVHAIRERLMRIMWDDVGIMRTAQGIERGIEKISELNGELMETGLDDADRVFNLTWHDWLNIQNLIDVSETIAKAAFSRENSRGAHFREDFPDQGDLHTSYFTVVRRTVDDVVVDREPVEFTIVKPGESLVGDLAPVQATAQA